MAQGGTCWKQLNVSQVLFPASSSHYFASTADKLARARIIVYSTRNACVREMQACLASEADYLHRVLWVDRSLTANIHERFVRIVSANNIVARYQEILLRYIVRILYSWHRPLNDAERYVDVIILVETTCNLSSFETNRKTLDSLNEPVIFPPLLKIPPRIKFKSRIRVIYSWYVPRLVSCPIITLS